MAITINGTIAAARVNASTAPTITVNSVATGEGVVVLFVLGSAETITSVAISGETNATQIGTTFAPGGSFGTDRGFAYIFPNIAGSTGNKTVTITKSSTSDCNMRAFRISGHDTSSPIGNTNSGTGAGAPVSISLTTASDNSMVIGELKCIATLSAGTGYTGITTTPTGVYEWEHLWVYDEDAGTAGSKTVASGGAPDDEWGIWAAEIKAATVGGGTAATIAAYYAMLNNAG